MHSPHMQVPYSRGEQYAQQVDALFCETSALTAKNVEELFVKISKYNTYCYVFVFTHTHMHT